MRLDMHMLSHVCVEDEQRSGPKPQAVAMSFDSGATSQQTNRVWNGDDLWRFSVMTHVCISRETSQDKSCAGTEHDCLGGIQYYSYVYVIMHYLMCQCCMFVVYVFVCIYFVSFMFFGTQYYSITVWARQKGSPTWPPPCHKGLTSSGQQTACYVYIYI